jgi:hypothetical protein
MCFVDGTPERMSEVPDSERALEIEACLEGRLIERLRVTRKPIVQLGEQRRRRRSSAARSRSGIDLELPFSIGVPRFPLARLLRGRIATYAVVRPPHFIGHLIQPDGRAVPIDCLIPLGAAHILLAEERLHLVCGGIALSLRYVRKRELPW